MRKVLFVDDDPNIVRGLKRMLHGMRHEWRVECAVSGAEALDRIAAEPFDVIVSDMKMAGMDGAELLARVREIHPDSVRIVLSGHSERTAILKSLGPSHQYLAKPCDADTLKQTLGRAFALRQVPANEEMRRRVSQIDFLPGLDAPHRRLVEELASPSPRLPAVARILDQDIGMAANILRITNSAYFGHFRPVQEVARAVTCLGLETIADLLRVPVFRPRRSPKEDPLLHDRLTRRSRAIAHHAREIARLEGADEQTTASAVQAGMLHAVGRLLLATIDPDGFERTARGAAQRGVSLHEVQKEAYGATEAGLGAYLIGLWGLPSAVVEAVAFQADPTGSPVRPVGALTFLHAARALASEADPEDPAPVRLDEEYFADLGLQHRVEAWRGACPRAAAQAGSEP